MTNIKVREYWESYIFNISYYGIRHLNEVYDKCSDAKQSAWNHIEKEYKDSHGFKLSVITYSARYFIAGYMYKDGDKLMFKVHTLTDYDIMELNRNDKFYAVLNNVL